MPGFELAAISSGASLLGIPWQHYLQKDLMHENEAINIAQWERENEYNSPAAQMRRLKEAGLNPDLAIAGNVANTAGSITPTTGTPQAAGAASAVGRAVSNALEASQVESQIELNESVADKNRAESENVHVDSQFKIQSMDVRLKQLWSNLRFSEQQTKQAEAQTENIQMSSLVLQKEVENFNEVFRNYDFQRKLWNNQALLAGFQSGIARIDLSRRASFLDSHIAMLESEAGLNKAYANKLRTENNFLLQTFSDRARLINNEALFKRPQDQLFNAQYRYTMALLGYLPYQMGDLMLNLSKHTKKDKDGNILIENGFPVFEDGYVAWERSFDYVNDFSNILKDVSQSFENVMIGVGVARGFGGFGAARSVSAPTPIPSAPWDKAEEQRLYQKYQSATPHSAEQSAARDAWLEYRKRKSN